MPDLSVLFALLVTLVVALVVMLLGYALIVAFARVLHRYMPALSKPPDPALDVLCTRLASGDIDESEFQRLRTVLGSR